MEEREDKGGGGGEAGLRGDQVEGKGKGNQVDRKGTFLLIIFSVSLKRESSSRSSVTVYSYGAQTKICKEKEEN